jgi:hypothetical protein
VSTTPLDKSLSQDQLRGLPDSTARDALLACLPLDRVMEHLGWRDIPPMVYLLVRASQRSDCVSHPVIVWERDPSGLLDSVTALARREKKPHPIYVGVCAIVPAVITLDEEPALATSTRDPACQVEARLIFGITSEGITFALRRLRGMPVLGFVGGRYDTTDTLLGKHALTCAGLHEQLPAAHEQIRRIYTEHDAHRTSAQTGLEEAHRGQ